MVRCLVAVWPHPWMSPVDLVIPEVYSLVCLRSDVDWQAEHIDLNDLQATLWHALSMVHLRVWHEPCAMRLEEYVSSYYSINVRFPGSACTTLHRVHAWITLRQILQWAEHTQPHWRGRLRVVCHDIYIYDSLDYSLFSAAVDPGTLVDMQIRHVSGREEDHMVRV